MSLIMQPVNLFIAILYEALIGAGLQPTSNLFGVHWWFDWYDTILYDNIMDSPYKSMQSTTPSLPSASCAVRRILFAVKSTNVSWIFRLNSKYAVLSPSSDPGHYALPRPHRPHPVGSPDWVHLICIEQKVHPLTASNWQRDRFRSTDSVISADALVNQGRLRT